MEHSDYLDQTTTMLAQEWSYLPSWADGQQIRARLIERSTADNHQVTLVALDAEDNVTGTASLIHYELNDEPQRMYWLGEVVTKAENRGQGIGSALIAHIVKVATARGITQLWLYTPDKQSFYRNLGWKNHEQRTVSGEYVTVMVLELCT